MSPVFKKVRNKFLIFNLVITCLILLVAFVAIYTITYHNTMNENRQRLASLSDQVIYERMAIHIGDRSSGMIVFDPQMTSTFATSFSLFLDEGGRLMLINSILDYPQTYYEEAAVIAWNQSEEEQVSLAGRQWLYTTVPLLGGWYRVDFLDITDTQDTLRGLLITFFLVGVLSFGAIFILSLYYANRSIAPIIRMWEAQKQFVADASHELKTPLSLIIANYDVLKSNENATVKSQEEWLSYIKLGANRMTELINRLLLLAKTEDSGIVTSRHSFSLSDLAHQVAATMEAAALKKQVVFSKQIEAHVDLNGDEAVAGQILEILLENAVKYVDTGGTINFSLTKNGKQVVLVVENSGDGIAKEHLPKLFDRFYRVDQARSSEQGGFGLGLAIAKSLVAKTKGKISVESEVGTFTRFTVTFN